MHVPDGFLSAKVAGACVAMAAAGVAIGCARARRQFGPPRVALIGVTAAFVFAAQMVNFPVAMGTSGHLVGAALATALVGVGPAIVVMTSVLFAQCLVFGDGGVLALGANVLNMGVVEPAVAGLLLAVLGGRSPSFARRLAALGCAAWTATVLAALFCAGELALSGMAPAGAVFPAMGGIHMLIGIGEALMSLLVMATIARTRPELLSLSREPSRAAFGSVVGLGLIVSVGIALFLAPFASRWPDGLERTARDLGFVGRAFAAPVVHPVLEGYRVPGVGNPILATTLAGVAGAMAVFLASWLVGRWLTPAAETERAR